MNHSKSIRKCRFKCTFHALGWGLALQVTSYSSYAIAPSLTSIILADCNAAWFNPSCFLFACKFERSLKWLGTSERSPINLIFHLRKVLWSRAGVEPLLKALILVFRPVMDDYPPPGLQIYHAKFLNEGTIIKNLLTVQMLKMIVMHELPRDAHPLLRYREMLWCKATQSEV